MSHWILIFFSDGSTSFQVPGLTEVLHPDVFNLGGGGGVPISDGSTSSQVPGLTEVLHPDVLNYSGGVLISIRRIEGQLTGKKSHAQYIMSVTV